MKHKRKRQLHPAVKYGLALGAVELTGEALAELFLTVAKELIKLAGHLLNMA